MHLRWLFAFSLVVIVATRKHHHHSSEEEEEGEEQPSGIESKGKEIVDRMMVNMAGAVVKSIFPEMDKLEKKTEEVKIPAASASGDLRRAPYPSQYGASSQDNYGVQPGRGEATLEGAGLSGMGNGLGALGNPQLGALAGAMAPLLGGGSGAGAGMDPRMINEMRNQAYLAELAKHQHELTSYSAKQMQYLDEQRRYQQAMIDHQAEAALLMQKEQQQNINQQMNQAQAMYAKQRSLMAARAAAHASRTHVPQEEKRISKPGDRSLTSDADLKQFLKENYSVDLSNDGPLTDEERETLRMLKVELAIKKSKKQAKGGAISTMDEAMYTRPSSSSSHGSSSTRPVSDVCDKCMSFSIRKLKGAWTQVYGNPDVIKRTFGTILSLERMNATGSTRMSTSMRSKKPACVGMEIGAYDRGEAELNFFYREDLEGHKLHEMRGELVKQDEKNMMLETDMYSSEMCLLRAGPSGSDKPEYIVLAETKGTYACRSLHVFARNIDDFNRRHFDDISNFMKEQVSRNNALPVGVFKMAESCQLNEQ